MKYLVVLVFVFGMLNCKSSHPKYTAKIEGAMLVTSPQ